jgi:hypothetical protein
MSSPGFRDAIKLELATRWTATPVLDLSDYLAVDDLPATGTDPVLLLQFIGGPDRMATIAQEGNHGWREDGVFYFHLLLPTGEPAARALSLGEQLRGIFRGRRLGSYVIDNIEPFSDFAGAAIRVNGKWHGWSAAAAYYNVICG